VDSCEGQAVKRFPAIATILTLALAVAVGAFACWLVLSKPSAKPADKPPSPATVDKVVKEDDLNAVSVSEAAGKRIGLTVAPVQSRSVRRVRVYGGEATIPIGRVILVTAPLGGTLKAPPAGMPKAGQAVRAGQPVLQLFPLLTPDGQASLTASLVDTDGQVNNSRTQVEVNRIALDRSKRVLKEGAGSQRLVDESQAAFDLATKSLEAATARRAILAKVVGDAESGSAAPLPIDAPEDGILRTLSALPGQTVPGGAPLFEVVDLSTIWVRVPLPVGDLDSIDRHGVAQVGKLSSPPSLKLASAVPVAAPPSANPLSSTVDLFYEMPNSDSALIPGQRLGVTLPLSDAKDGLTVPWSAVFFDIHGGTWVFVQTAPRSFVRNRVVVSHTSGPDAVLATGPSAGTKVATAGVQQLFGAETGFIK